MSCEKTQEQVSLLIDAELPEPEQMGLYRHLQECGECRSFLDTMFRFRSAARKDQEMLLTEAEEALPHRFRAEPRPARRWLNGGWRIPVPVAAALGAVLLVGGALLGSRMDRAPVTSPETVRPAVVVVCGLPPVDVVGTNP